MPPSRERSSRAEDLLPEPSARVATEVVTFAGGVASGERAIPVEVAVEIVYGGVPFAVMMMSPEDLEDFAHGFSLTEGIIEGAGDLRGVRHEVEARGHRLLIDLAPGRMHAHLARRRSLSGRTGCGVCGIEDLDALPRAREPEGAAPTLSAAAVARALAALEGAQPLNVLTRAVHAAAYADRDGRLVAVREDVGRHNALDKLVGAVLRAGVRPEDGFVLVTSRCSFEMVEKSAALGARALVAISGPTSLALERARRLDLTLVAVARRDSMTVFHGAERVVAGASEHGARDTAA